MALIANGMVQSKNGLLTEMADKEPGSRQQRKPTAILGARPPPPRRRRVGSLLADRRRRAIDAAVASTVEWVDSVRSTHLNDGSRNHAQPSSTTVPMTVAAGTGGGGSSASNSRKRTSSSIAHIRVLPDLSITASNEDYTQWTTDHVAETSTES